MVEVIRSKSDIEAIAKLLKDIESLKADFSVLKEHVDRMCPHLVDDERKRAAQLWEAAQYAHNSADPGEPGPIAVIARGMRDVEERMLVVAKPIDQALEDDLDEDGESGQ